MKQAPKFAPEAAPDKKEKKKGKAEQNAPEELVLGTLAGKQASASSALVEALEEGRNRRLTDQVNYQEKELERRIRRLHAKASREKYREVAGLAELAERIDIKQLETDFYAEADRLIAALKEHPVEHELSAIGKKPYAKLIEKLEKIRTTAPSDFAHEVGWGNRMSIRTHLHWGLADAASLHKDAFRRVVAPNAGGNLPNFPDEAALRDLSGAAIGRLRGRVGEYLRVGREVVGHAMTGQEGVAGLVSQMERNVIGINRAIEMIQAFEGRLEQAVTLADLAQVAGTTLPAEFSKKIYKVVAPVEEDFGLRDSDRPMAVEEKDALFHETVLMRERLARLRNAYERVIAACRNEKVRI